MVMDNTSLVYCEKVSREFYTLGAVSCLLLLHNTMNLFQITVSSSSFMWHWLYIYQNYHREKQNCLHVKEL